MGSVKDLEILEKPRENELGIGRFIFSDRYSIFDWGKMPDEIKDKGSALCLMGAYFFERAEEQGIKSHYRGLVEKGKIKKLDELENPTNVMEIYLVRVIKPNFKDGKYDYSIFTPNLKNFLIPLEMIYRNSLPNGSSVFRRLEREEITYQDLGLDHYPEPGEILENPIFDVSTKLEESDRYISWKEAQKIAGLNDEEIHEIKEFLSSANNLITEIVGKAGLTNEDGKIELAYDPNKNLIVVDVAGTPDECRFMYEGIPVSKEVARQYYKNTEWHGNVVEAKDLAKKQKTKDWKKLCKSQPEKLPSELKRIIENIYTSIANEILGKKFFDSPKFKEVIKEFKDWEFQYYN